MGLCRDFSKSNATIVNTVKANKPDILWIDKGLIVNPKTLIKARQYHPKIVIVSYSPDDMLNPDNQTSQYLKSIPLYDLHVTTKSYNVPELTDLGAKDVLFVGNAFCTQMHQNQLLSSTEKQYWGGEVGFVGSYEKERAESILFLAKNKIQVKVWGLWPASWVSRLSRHGVITSGTNLVGTDYSKAISAFDINLNFLRKVNRDLQTTRSIEIPACGGFMLAERTAEHQSLFKEGEEAAYFDSNEELLQKIRYYQTHPIERDKIQEAGFRRCTSSYSNEKRLESVLTYINEPKK